MDTLMNKLWIFLLCTALALGQFLSNSYPECNPGTRPLILKQPGSFAAPLYPNDSYVHDLHCQWRIQAPSGSVVSLQFLHFELEDVFPCVYTNVTIYDSFYESSHNRLERYCAHDKTQPLHSSATDMLVVYKSGFVGKGSGFNATFHFIDLINTACDRLEQPMILNWTTGGFVSPDWPNDYRTGSDCFWKIISPSNLDIRLEFISFQIREANNGDCLLDNVRINDEFHQDDPLHIYCGSDVPNPIGISGNNMSVKFKRFSDRTFPGFQTRFRAINTTDWACGTSRPAEIDWNLGYITSPSTDTSTCGWRFTAAVGMMIELSISSFDLPECTNCGCAGVDVYDGENQYGKFLGRYCGSGWDEPIRIGGNKGYIYYSSYTVAGAGGFKILFRYHDIAEIACGEGNPIELSNQFGQISSPNYGRGNYPHRSDCGWLLKAELGQVVRVDFNEFDLQYCPACRCDSVRLYNGQVPDPELGVGLFCDNARPPPVTTTQQNLLVKFKSDEYNHARGFQLRYEFQTLSNLACKGHRLAEMRYSPGDILSPGDGYVDGNYPRNALCNWVVRSGANDPKEIEVTFVRFDLEYDSARCRFDNLTIYDGEDSSGTVVFVGCGNELPLGFRSKTGSIYIVFRANEYLEHTGFHLKYIFVDADRDSGFSFLPLLLGLIGVIVFVCLIAAYCNLKGRIKQMRDRLHRPRASNNNGTIPRNGSSNHPYHPDDEFFDPDPPRIVSRPPSYVDNQEYFAIADYPPPTYADIFSGSGQMHGVGSGDDTTNTDAPPVYTISDGVYEQIDDATNGIRRTQSRDNVNNNDNDVGNRDRNTNSMIHGNTHERDVLNRSSSSLNTSQVVPTPNIHVMPANRSNSSLNTSQVVPTPNIHGMPANRSNSSLNTSQIVPTPNINRMPATNSNSDQRINVNSAPPVRRQSSVISPSVGGAADLGSGILTVAGAGTSRDNNLNYRKQNTGLQNLSANQTRKTENRNSSSRGRSLDDLRLAPNVSPMPDGQMLKRGSTGTLNAAYSSDKMDTHSGRKSGENMRHYDNAQSVNVLRGSSSNLSLGVINTSYTEV